MSDESDATEVAVLLLGDDCIGKSSLLASFTANDFTVPAGGPLVDQRIPSSLPGSLMTLHLIDSSADEGDLSVKCNFADVILLCYDTTDLKTLDSVRDRWISFLKDHVPELEARKLLLVGLKADSASELASPEESDLCALLMTDHACVLESLRCSARRLTVGKVFARAELNHSYPVAPLYSNGRFTPKCYRAFKRIFRLYDTDCDGLWDTSEFTRFQKACFGVCMSEREVALMTARIAGKHPFGVIDGRITLDGFFAMLALYVTPLTASLWAILHAHGYDADLDLDVPEGLLCAPPPLLPGYAPSLSRGAIEFLSRLAEYTMRARGEDLSMSREDLQSVFSVVDVSVSVPWLGETYPLGYPGQDQDSEQQGCAMLLLRDKETPLTIPQWLAQWHLLASLDAGLCARLLFLVGFASGSSGIDTGVVARRTLQPRPSELLDPLCLLGRQAPRPPSLIVAVLTSSQELVGPLLSALEVPADLHVLGAEPFLLCSTVGDTSLCYWVVSIDSPQRPALEHVDLIVFAYCGRAGDEASLNSALPPGLNAIPRAALCLSSVEVAADSILLEGGQGQGQGQGQGLCVPGVASERHIYLLGGGLLKLDASVSAVATEVVTQRRRTKMVFTMTCAALLATAAVVMYYASLGGSKRAVSVSAGKS